MSVLLRVDVNAETAIAWFDYAGYRIRDARNPMREVMLDVVWPAVRGQLDSQGARGGDPWQALSAQYQAWKDANYPGRPILVLTGKMEEQLFNPLSFHTTRDSLVYKPESDYLHWHQDGGYEEGRPPQRVVLDLIPEDYEKIQIIFDAWLFELANANIRRTASPDFHAPLPDFFI